ncbi:Uncharacterized protein Fot_04333 [Forsythia ovata]|uniref:Uncharacterized protein n=1 Tax=Forsythia ovata TaxID=205694 RepID=A0ABD1XCD6_9LAMI
MPRVIMSTAHLGWSAALLGAVDQLLLWGWSTAHLGAVDCLPRSGRLPPESSWSTAPLGAVYSLPGSSLSTVPFGAVVGNSLTDRHMCDNVEIERSPTGNIIALEIPKYGSDKNALVSAGRPMGDDHIDLHGGADPMQADDNHTAGDSPVPDLHFPPTHAR